MSEFGELINETLLDVLMEISADRLEAELRKEIEEKTHELSDAISAGMEAYVEEIVKMEGTSRMLLHFGSFMIGVSLLARDLPETPQARKVVLNTLARILSEYFAKMEDGSLNTMLDMDLEDEDLQSKVK